MGGPPVTSGGPPRGPAQDGGGRHPALAVALVLLKVGALAFGGPATHVAFMRRELVERLAGLRAALCLSGLDPVPRLAAAGLAVLAVRQAGGRTWLSPAGLAGLPGLVLLAHAGRLPLLFWTFLEIGAISFGSGYVLFAYL